MLQDIPKMCADSLRKFIQEKYNIKIKATHAHELVAAYFGYTSKNAMLADTRYPVRRIDEAEIVIMTPDSDIKKRRGNLNELPPDLPSNYDLGEPIFTTLFSNECWVSQHPPFKSFQKAAKFLVENDYNFQEAFKFYRDIQLHHIVSVLKEPDYVTLSVVHATRNSRTTNEFIGNGETTVRLPRVAGHIGFGKPQILVGTWTGGARKKFVLSEQEGSRQ